MRSLLCLLLLCSPAVAAKPRYVIRTSAHGGSVEALAEVNAARAQRGLPPFAHDEELYLAACRCAELRAQYRIAGHTANDFAALRPGNYAAAAGCGALEWSWGWGTCCTYENYRFAGAAYVVGADGKRYMHLFVR